MDGGTYPVSGRSADKGDGGIIRPPDDGLLAYKRAPFLLPTMLLLNSKLRIPELFRLNRTH